MLQAGMGGIDNIAMSTLTRRQYDIGNWYYILTIQIVVFHRKQKDSVPTVSFGSIDMDYLAKQNIIVDV